MSAIRHAPLIGRRAVGIIVALALVVGLVAVFSGTLSRSTDTEARADEARAEVRVRELELAAAQEERDFFETDDFVRWQARVHGFGRAAETRFALPEATAGAQWWGPMAFAAIDGDITDATFDPVRPDVWRR